MTARDLMINFYLAHRAGKELHFRMGDVNIILESHNRMYALIKRIEAAGEAFFLPDAISEEITAIIAEMEPQK